MGSSAVEYQDIPQGFEIQQDPSEARFKKAASFTFRPDVEGGYVVDHAGPTNMGLTQKFYDSYAKQNKLPPKNVQDMDPVEIKGVIKSEFFDKAGLGQMPDALAVAMFDYTVNSGVSKAVKDLQKVLGVKQDGVVGQQTLDAIYAHPDEKALLKGLINERESFMKKLIKDDPATYKDYENGWRNRINNLRKSLDLSFLNPFHTPEASADEIPAEAPYADIPEGFALGHDNIPEVQPDQYEDIPKGFEVAQASAKQEPQGDDLASLLAKDAARYPRPFTKEEVDSYKAGALGALEPFLSRTTDIYKDPDTKEFLDQHPIAKAVGQTARDLALLVPIGKLTAGVVNLPFIPKLAQGVAKMASGTALGKKLFNTMEATRYVAKAVHSGATFGTLAAVKEATIETPDQNLISSAQHIAGNALWGAGLGLVTAAPNYLARVATAGTYGGVTTALSGGDPLDVALNTVLFGGFELISGKSVDRNIKLQAVQNIRRATSEYLAKGGMSPDDAVKMADTAINNSITKAGGLDNVVENNSAPFMNQLASEIQKLKPTWGLSKPKNLPNYAPFESPKPEAPKPTQPQPPAQPQSNAGETMPAPFKSPADAPTSPSAEVLTAPPVDVAADAQKPAVSTPEANKGDVLKEDAASYQKSGQTAIFNGKEIAVLNDSVEITTEDMVLKPEKTKNIIGPAFIQDGKVYGGPFDLENNANHGDVFIKNKLDQNKAKPGFLTKNNEFIYQYKEDILKEEQDAPYGDKGKEDQYLDYLKTQRITKEYKNDKSYAADIERQIRKREGGIAEETTGYGKPAKTFYSQLERVIETKMPNAATPEMVRGLLSDKNGVKKEEYEWMGVEEFLEGKQKVTKAELQEFIRQNQVEVKEVFKGAAEGDNANIEKAFKEKGLDISVDPNGELLITDKNGDELIFEDIEKSYPELLSLAEQYENNNGNPADVRGAPKFANYQLPGGENYRELLLTLPGNTFKSQHFDEPGIIAHVRMNDRMSVGSGFVEAKKNEPGTDSFTADAKLLPDLVKSQAFISKGYSGLNVEDQKTVLSGVISAISDKEIGRDIISLVPVDVMNDLVRAKTTPENFFHNNTMLTDSLSGNPDAFVKLGSSSKRSLISTVADLVAKRISGSSNLTRQSIQSGQAPSTFGNHREYRILFIEELQSDLHQKGRKDGYRSDVKGLSKQEEMRFEELAKKEALSETTMTPMERKELSELQRKWLLIEKAAQGVPDAPFKKTWHELALKRMLRYAAENGYDKLAWTTGEQQAERYDLSKQVDEVRVSKSGHGSYGVTIRKDGQTISTKGAQNDNELAELVGKELANKIAQDERLQPDKNTVAYSGLDLKVGGEGMKGFYDQILPSFMNKYAKKWGGRVEQSRVDVSDPIADAAHLKFYPPNNWYTTDEKINVQKSVLDKKYRVWDYRKAGSPKEVGIFDTYEQAKAEITNLINAEIDRTAPVHSIDITPSMKKSVVEEGQALFEHPEQYQNVKMRYFNGEGQLVREEQLNFLKSEKEVSNGKGIPDRGREAGVAPTLNGRSLWKSPAALKFKKDGYLVMPDQKIEGPEDVAFAFQFLKDAAQEHFYIVPVKDGQALAAELITIGTYNSAQPAIYEILGLLEKTGADSVYMVHNHPNGRMEPSSDDMKFTTRAMGVLDKIKVKFNGHIIIDTDKFVFIKSGQNRGLTADVIPHKQYARTRKVEVLKKYMEWSAGKESTPQIKKADDIYEVIKGITVDPKSGIVVLLNNQMRIMNMYAMPQDKINANEIMRLSARERTSAVITVNTGMDTLTTLDLMDDLNDVGMKLLDDIEVTAPGKYTSKQERGVLEAPEPYQGKIAEEGPKEITPEDQFDALTPEEQAQFALEMDDLRKTPEGNLFIAIKRIGGIAPHRGGKLKEEYAEIPLFLKNNKGQPLDDFISQLQQYGWNFETENELIQEINRQAANPVEKVDRASLRKIIRDAQKNKRLKGTIKEKLFGKRRKFIQTVKDSENTKPEVAKAVESRYEPISNKETMTKAQAFVAESPDEAVQMIESNIKPDAFHNAVGIELIRIAQNEGRIQDAVRLVERMAEKQTALGQAIQALSMYNRLSPEGILMAAQRSIRRAKDTLPRHKVDQFEKLARDMKNPKDVEKLAKRMGVPHMTEDLAKDLVERAKKIGSAPQWEMPSVPEAKNAIQNLIDEFYSLGVEGQNNLPPEVKNAIQFTINEFEKLGVDGENTPIAKNAIQKIFKEFESLGVDGENTPMGPGIQQFMDIGRIKAARSGLIETALMLQKIQNQIPRTIWEKISMAQTIAQLLNPKTFIRNLLGNLIFQATENLADTVGAAIDIAVALNTGKRSVYLPNVKTQVKGAIQGFKEGYEEAVLGIDLKGQTLSKFTLPKNGVFNGGVMGGLEKTLRVALGATDRAFYQSAFNQSLEQQLKASGKKEIDEDMIERAHAIGLYRTFQDENILSRQFEQLKRWFNAGGKFGLGDVVLKYPRTPANLLHRGIEYSPFGFLHTVMRIADPLIFGKEFDQERFVRQTSRALTGSALLVGAGAVLAALGIISGKRSKDPDIVETRRNSGIREYQINTSALKRFIMSGMNPDQAKMQEGDTLVSYDWMQPASIGIALGANMVLDPRTNLVDKTVNFADSMLQASETLQEQPLVRGVKTFTSRRNIAEGLSEVVKDMPASFVPTILNQVRQLTDNIARNTQDPNYLAEAGKKVAMRIPGASRALPAQINTLGEARQMYQDDSNSIFNVFFNPAFVSRYRPDPVSKMVLDIWGKTGETVQFPRTAPRSVKVPDSTEPLVLDPEQYQLFASYIGKKTNVLFNMKLEDPVFMALPDTEKAKKLESYLTDIKQAAMIDVLGIRPKGTDRGTMYIIKQIKTDLEKIKANEEDGIDFQPYSDVPEGFR